LDLAKWTQQSMGGSNTLGDGLARGVEFVLTPLICGIVGHFLDRWLGTEPVLTVILVVWAFAVTVGLTIRDYTVRMRAEEEKLLGPRPRPRSHA